MLGDAYSPYSSSELDLQFIIRSLTDKNRNDEAEIQ